MTLYTWMENDQPIGTTHVPKIGIVAPVVADGFAPVPVEFTSSVDGVLSNTISLDVYPPIKATVHSSKTQQHSVNVTSGANLSYRWSISTDNGETWVEVPVSGASISTDILGADLVKVVVSDPTNQQLSLEAQTGDLRSFIQMGVTPLHSGVVRSKSGVWAYQSTKSLPIAAGETLEWYNTYVIQKYPKGWSAGAPPEGEISNSGLPQTILLRSGNPNDLYLSPVTAYTIGNDLCLVEQYDEGTELLLNIITIGEIVHTHQITVLNDYTLQGITEDGDIYFYDTSSDYGSLFRYSLETATLEQIFIAPSNFVWQLPTVGFKGPGNSLPIILGNTEVVGGTIEVTYLNGGLKTFTVDGISSLRYVNVGLNSQGTVDVVTVSGSGAQWEEIRRNNVVEFDFRGSPLADLFGSYNKVTLDEEAKILVSTGYTHANAGVYANSSPTTWTNLLSNIIVEGSLATSYDYDGHTMRRYNTLGSSLPGANIQILSDGSVLDSVGNLIPKIEYDIQEMGTTSNGLRYGALRIFIDPVNTFDSLNIRWRGTAVFPNLADPDFSGFSFYVLDVNLHAPEFSVTTAVITEVVPVYSRALIGSISLTSSTSIYSIDDSSIYPI